MWKKDYLKMLADKNKGFYFAIVTSTFSDFTDSGVDFMIYIIKSNGPINNSIINVSPSKIVSEKSFVGGHEQINGYYPENYIGENYDFYIDSEEKYIAFNEDGFPDVEKTLENLNKINGIDLEIVEEISEYDFQKEKCDTNRNKYIEEQCSNEDWPDELYYDIYRYLFKLNQDLEIKNKKKKKIKEYILTESIK